MDRNAVPMLRHGTENNFPTHKKKLAVAVLEKYHDLGRMIDLGEYYVPDAVDADLYDLDDDPHGLNLSEYKDARKTRLRNMDRMKSDRAGMFAFMMLHLSNESLDAIKLVDDWDEANHEKDPLMLWQLMEATHRVGIDSRIPAVVKAESRRAYQSCAQSAYESIVKFKERFDDLLANYLEYENPEMEDVDVAMDFYRALDNSRYAAFKTNLVNSVNSGATEQPASLNEMYSQASSYLIPTKQQHAGTHRTAFATTADKSWDNSGSRQGDRGGGKGRGEGRSRKEKGGESKAAAPSGDAHANRDCWGCGETGHILRDCPSVPVARETGSKDGEVRMTHLQCHWSDDSDDDDEMPELGSDSDSGPDDEGTIPGLDWDSDAENDEIPGLAASDSDSDFDDDDYDSMPGMRSSASESEDEDEGEGKTQQLCSRTRLTAWCQSPREGRYT